MCGRYINECLNCKKPDCDNDFVPKPCGYTEAQKRFNKKKSALKKERAAQGVCTECGKHPARAGYKMCLQCQIKYSHYKADELLRKGVKPRSLLDGFTLCAKCGKDEPKPGYRVCERCYKSNIANLAKTPTHRGVKRENDLFRQGVDLFWRASQSQKSASPDTEKSSHRPTS